MKELMSMEPHLDGLMIGRLAFQDPWVMAKIDHELFGKPPTGISWLDVITAYKEFIKNRESEIAGKVIKPIINFFANEIG